MAITPKLRGLMLLIPKIRPEAAVAWALLAVAAWAVLEEWARWLSVP